MTENPPGWHPDPMGRHEHRYWDGTQWTDNVADQGDMSMDPVLAEPQAITAPAEPSRVDLPAIDPSQIRVTGAMPAIKPQQQETPAPTPEPATPAAAEPTPEPVAPTPEPVATPAPEPITPAAAAAAEAPTEPYADTAIAEPEPAELEYTGLGRHPILGGLLSVAAPGSGHLYLGVRRQIGYGLIGAFVVAIIVSWFVSWPIGLIIYLAAAAFAVFDLRGEVIPAARSGEAAFETVDLALAWRIVLGGGIAMILGLILPWYRIAADVSVAGISQSTSASANGFQSHNWLDLLLLVIGLVAVVVAALHVTGSSNARSVPAVLPKVLAVAAGIAWLVVIWRLLDIPGDTGEVSDLNGLGGAKVEVTFGRGIGAWLDYAAALAVAAGAYAVSTRND